MKTKAELRAQIRQARRGVEPDQSTRDSRAIEQAAWQLVSNPGITNIGIYLSLPGEVDTAGLIHTLRSRGKRLAVPYQDPIGEWSFSWLATEVQDGAFNIPQPAVLDPCPLDALDLLFIPGLAADRDGARLGRGGGIYDRFLSGRAALRVGLFFDWQLLLAIPTEPHDQRLDVLITPSAVIGCSKRGKGFLSESFPFSGSPLE